MPDAGKVAVGFATHRTYVTDFNGLSAGELNGLGKGDDYPANNFSWDVTLVYLFFWPPDQL